MPGRRLAPSFGSPAVRRCCLTRGFAAPSRDGCALIGRGVFSLSGGALVHGGCQAGARGGPRCLKIWKLRGLEGTCRVRSAYPRGPGERRRLSCLTVHAPILAPLSSRIVYLSETYDYSRF